MPTDSLPIELLELFPDADYRHRMRFQEGSISGFFGRTDASERILGERRRWLDSDAAACAIALPEAKALLENACELLGTASVLPQNAVETSNLANPREALLALGRILEPDLLLLHRNGSGELRLLGGCVCFPSSWSLTEKVGQPLEIIHQVVPGLNAQLAQPINAFLARMVPGAAWLRSNWGLSRSPELNQHPARRLRKLDGAVGLDQVWLRIENQALVSLPATDGVLFGIRIAVYPLAEVTRSTEMTGRLLRALRTMPEPMAKYKNIADARESILALLCETASRVNQKRIGGKDSTTVD